MGSEQLNIFLIDDDEDDFIITRDLLNEIESTKITLEWTSDCDTGLEAMKANRFDLYLLDYRLGERNGLDLLCEAMEGGCIQPIILLTGHEDREIDMRAMGSGAADYLVKSRIDAAQLERSIRYAIERQSTDEKIKHLAYYDSLTGLPNRTLFDDRLKQVLAHGERYTRMAAMLFLDLDNFKKVNDTLGHSVGDILLQEVAERLSLCVRKTDSISRLQEESSEITVARRGGDEFTILLSEIRKIEDAAKVAQRFLNALSKPFYLEGEEIYVSASIGIAIHPDDGHDIDTLHKNADAAMYYAKEHGKNNFQYYKKSMNAAAISRLTMESELRKAMTHNEFVLHFQPQIEIATGRLVGMEALVRWVHREKGMIPPLDFIPVAEETGLIIPIGEWVLNTACRQCKKWENEGYPNQKISVNLSSVQFKQPDLASQVSSALKGADLDPACLVLEITESCIMENTDHTIEALNILTGLGISFAVDDFGTGYSSLSYLKRFPLAYLKIDRSFIKEVPASEDDAAISEAIIAMAHRLKLKTIAEGVESEEQLSFLLANGCDQVQGFLFSRPVPPVEADDLLSLEKENKGIGIKICRKIVETPAVSRR